MSRPARVIVDVAALKANFRVVKSRAPNARVMAIVKADGYGHGIATVANALAEFTDAFGVASLEEAIRLRDAGIERSIVLLEGLFAADELDAITQLDLQIVVHSFQQLALLSKAESALTVWVKIDSGMHRLGFAPADTQVVVNKLTEQGHGVRFMTHLANAQLDSDGTVERQLAVFDTAIKGLTGARSVANSGAVLAWPESHVEWVRPGLMLYGVSPFETHLGRDHELRAAMTVVSELIAIREIGAGECVGYGETYRTRHPMRIGVVAFGYGDGYPRHARTGTPILVRGVRTQILGEASMDMLSVDLTPLADAEIGDPVVLWGPELPVEEIARSAATIPYELLCRVGLRARHEAIDQ